MADYPRGGIPPKYLREHGGDEEAARKEWAEEWQYRLDHKEDHPSWDTIGRGENRLVAVDLETAEKILDGRLSGREVLDLIEVKRTGVGQYWYLFGHDGAAAEDNQVYALKDEDLTQGGKADYEYLKKLLEGDPQERLRELKWTPDNAKNMAYLKKYEPALWRAIQEDDTEAIRQFFLDDFEKVGGKYVFEVEFPVVFIAERPPGWHSDDNKNMGLMGNSFIPADGPWKTVTLKAVQYLSKKGWVEKPVRMKVKLTGAD